jgi:large subunit ribosomal protein L1
MGQRSKRLRDIDKKVELGKVYALDAAVNLLKECPPVKFDQSVEVAVRMDLDPRKSDQNVRGTVALPNGTGKSLRVLALVQGERIAQALEAGADLAGDKEYVEKIQNGWTDFDALVTTPDMMREVGKLGKVLGPRGLMPTPKAGTVTADIAKAIKEIKGGKIEFKLDRHGVISALVGKLSFAAEKLNENIESLLEAIRRAKPPGAKGQYIRSASLSSTMGPGLKIDVKPVERA